MKKKPAKKTRKPMIVKQIADDLYLENQKQRMEISELEYKLDNAKYFPRLLTIDDPNPIAFVKRTNRSLQQLIKDKIKEGHPTFIESLANFFTDVLMQSESTSKIDQVIKKVDALLKTDPGQSTK